jgi:transposase InsO family protein
LGAPVVGSGDVDHVEYKKEPIGVNSRQEVPEVGLSSEFGDVDFVDKLVAAVMRETQATEECEACTGVGASRVCTGVNSECKRGSRGNEGVGDRHQDQAARDRMLKPPLPSRPKTSKIGGGENAEKHFSDKEEASGPSGAVEPSGPVDFSKYPQSSFVIAAVEDVDVENMVEKPEESVRQLFRIAMVGLPGSSPHKEKEELARQKVATVSASVSAELEMGTFVQGRRLNNKYRCRAVLDRGSHRSFVSVAQLRDWVRSGVQVEVLDGKRSRHVAFGGHIVETLGRVRVHGHFKGESSQRVTLVVEVSTDSLFNILLGLDFIMREDILVVPSTGRLYMCKGLEIKLGAPSICVDVNVGPRTSKGEQLESEESVEAQAVIQPSKRTRRDGDFKCFNLRDSKDGTPLVVCVPRFSVIASVVPEKPASAEENPATRSSGDSGRKRTKEEIEKELRSVEHYEELLRVLEVDQMPLSDQEKGMVRDLIREYQDCFALKMDQLGKVNILKAQIHTGSHPPVRCQAYRVGPKERELIEAEIQKMLDAGVIRPSMSPWASPVVLVEKADGSVRFAIDYRRLNGIATKDAYPLPRINDYLDVLGGAKYFSILDALSGFWQIAMNEEPQGLCAKCGGSFHSDTSVAKTAFITHTGLFEWTRLPFGLTSSPSIYQRVMDAIFRDLIWKELVVYVDDICSFAETFPEAIARLARVLTRLRAANMRVKAQKCKLFRTSVKFLGFLIKQMGVTVDPQKMEPIIKLKVPTNVDELRTFLGLLVYYSQHIPDFARKTESLWSTVKGKYQFPLVGERLEVLNWLKQNLVSPKILGFPNWEWPFEVHTDASRKPGALGAVLLQRDPHKKEERVLGFFSRLLHGAEHNYSVTELECLAVRWAVQKLRPYLYGRKFTVVTDHVALKWMFSMKDPNPRLNRWVDYLRGFDFDIVYRPGRKHQDADALSRLIERPGPTQETTEMPTTGEVLELGGYRPDEGEEDARFEGSQPALGRDYIDEGPVEETSPDVASRAERVSSIVASVRRYEGAKELLTKGDVNRIRTKVSSTLINMCKGNTAVWRLLVEEQARDRTLRSIRTRVEDGEVVRVPGASNIVYVVDESVVYVLYRARESDMDAEVEDRQCVVVPSRVRHQILNMYHGELPIGHLDRTKTLARLRRLFYWEGMGQDVRKFVQQCPVCQRANHKELNQGVLHSWTETQPFAVVGMDCLTLPKSSEGRTHVLVMVDLFSRYAEVQPLSGPPNSDEVTQAFLSKIVLRHGACGAIVTDKGSEFMNSIMGEVCERLGIEHVPVPTQVHSANGLAERFNRTLQLSLCKATGTVSTISEWDSLVEAAVFSYNTAYQEALQDSPFFIIHGRDAVLPTEVWTFNPEARVRVRREQGSKGEAKTELVRRFERAWSRAVAATKKVVERRLKASTRKDVTFMVGQQVWVYIPEIFRDGVHQKLLFKWHGPYRVIEEISPGILYKVRTERGRNLEQVFHVCRLKPFVAYDRRPDEQVILDANGEPQVFTYEDLTPSSARLESAEWRRKQRAQALGTAKKRYLLVQEPFREPTPAELTVVGKNFVDNEGRWVVTSVAYHPEHRIMVAFYEKLLNERGEWVSEQEPEYSSLPEVVDWVALSASRVHH